MSGAIETGTAPAVTNAEAYQRMENAMLDARMFSLLMRSVIDCTGLEMMVAPNVTMSDDEAEQISFLSLKLEHATVTAYRAFEEAFASSKGAAA